LCVPHLPIVKGTMKLCDIYIRCCMAASDSAHRTMIMITITIAIKMSLTVRERERERERER